MRSIWWPIALLCVLWVCTAVILPAWFGVIWIPRLVLAGLLVLAATDAEFKWHWCAPIAGLVFDLSTGTLPGTYMIGFSIIYILVRVSFFRIVPSDKIIPTLGLVFILSTFLLSVWMYLVGVLATVLNYPVVPINMWNMLLVELLRAGIGALATIGIYLIWLEFVHTFSKPIRLRRV